MFWYSEGVGEGLEILNPTLLKKIIQRTQFFCRNLIIIIYIKTKPTYFF